MGKLAPLAFILSLAVASTAVAQDDWSLTRRRPVPGNRGNRGERSREAREPDLQAPADRRELLIRRYTGLLLADPFQEASFERLVSLYRERDGNIEALLEQLRQQIDNQGESYELRVLLGHAFRANGRIAQARAAYLRAAEIRPAAPEPLVCRARLELEASDLPEARELLNAALELGGSADRRRELLQQLGLLALDAGDLESASRFYGELGRLSGGSLQAATGYARALFARERYALAAEQYRAVLTEMRGDARTVAPILLELGRAELKAGNAASAVEALLRARKSAQPNTGLLWDIDETLLEAGRSSGRLEELARLLQQERGGKNAGASRLLGRIWDELGEIDRAVDAYRRAVRGRPRETDTRERLIRLLSRDGRLDQVLYEYRALVRVAPGEPRYLVELGRLLSDLGQREQALELLARSGRRFARDPRIHRALYELYSRWGERERALGELAVLSRIEPGEPSHLATMGEQLMALGRRQEAIAAWRRIPRASADRAQAHATLGGLLADHGLELEALHEYREASRLRGDDIGFARGLAEMLERLNFTEEAVEQWQRVLALARDDRNARGQARRRLVGIWARSGKLQGRLDEYERRLARISGGRPAARIPGKGEREAKAEANRTPARGRQSEELSEALEAGRFLAEAYRYLAGRKPGSADRYRPQAERVLETVVALEPSDVESLLALERLRVARGDKQGALEILRLLAEADPANARSYYSRMAENALTLYRDDEAEGYAEKAVDLNRDDAEAQKRLGDLYREQQDMQNAIASYRRAIQLDERAYPIYLKLAEIHLSRGETALADELQLQVIRSSPDDELVARAARSSLQIELGEGSVTPLENALLPLALGSQQRPVFRRALVELYDAQVESLRRQAQGNEPGAGEARARLAALAKRSLRPLLDALWDREPEQRTSAVRLLGELENPNAAGPLLAFAEHEGEMSLRRRALIGAGRAAVIVQAADGRLAARLAALARGEEGLLAGAAAWALCRLGGPGAVLAMRELLQRPVTEVRAYAALGLGRARDTASLPGLRRLAREDRSESVRLHALLGLGYLGDTGSVPFLIEALHSGQQQIPAAAALALAEIGDRTSLEALAGAVFSPDRSAREAALMGLGLAAGGEPKNDPAERPLPAPGDFPSSAEAAAVLAPYVVSAARTADAFERHSDLLRDAARLALQGPGDSVEAVLDVLAAATGRSRDSEPREPAARTERSSLAGRLLPELLAAGRHPDAGVRARVLSLLAALGDERAEPAFLAALQDREESVQRTALERLDSADIGKSAAVLQAVSSIARNHPSWSMRARAVKVLGRLGGGEAEQAAIDALRDRYAYVRSAAARALGCIAGAASTRALARSLAEDREGLVRAAAADALARIDDPGAREALKRAGSDTHPAVRAALRGRRAPAAD